MVRGRDVYFARLAIPRWPANGTRLHTQRSHGNFQRKCRSPRLAELLLATPSVAAITRPHLRLLLHQIAWKTFKDCKRRCGTKSWICIHNMAEAAPLAGEPPQYTALVDCRRRWEVRLGAGALDPRLIPADQSQPATAPSAGGESRPLALLQPPTGPQPPSASCLKRGASPLIRQRLRLTRSHCKLSQLSH